MPKSISFLRQTTFQRVACFTTALALAGLSGCSSSGVAPSNTASKAGTGAMIGGLGGAAIGNNSSMGTATGAVGGAALGAITGGIIGMVQDARDRKEQDRLAQERAYQQDIAKRKAEEAKLKAEMDEELAIAQGFRISDIELNDAKKKQDDSNARLKKLQDERAAALAKKKELDDMREKTLANEAKIAALEEELTRLKGEDVQVPPANAGTDVAQKKPDANAPPPSVKPGT